MPTFVQRPGTLQPHHTTFFDVVEGCTEVVLIRPLSHTVPLWSGSSFGGFVYVGNDAETLKNTITVKISVGFPFQSNTRSGKTLYIKF